MKRKIEAGDRRIPGRLAHVPARRRLVARQRLRRPLVGHGRRGRHAHQRVRRHHIGHVRLRARRTRTPTAAHDGQVRSGRDAHERVRGTTSGEHGDGATHTNVDGGTTSGAYGAGAYHTDAYGATTAYHPPTTYYGGAYYHPPDGVLPVPVSPADDGRRRNHLDLRQLRLGGRGRGDGRSGGRSRGGVLERGGSVVERLRGRSRRRLGLDRGRDHQRRTPPGVRPPAPPRRPRIRRARSSTPFPPGRSTPRSTGRPTSSRTASGTCRPPARTASSIRSFRLPRGSSRPMVELRAPFERSP